MPEGASGASGWEPTVYPPSPPYFGGPDEAVPSQEFLYADGSTGSVALSSTGLADLAARTTADWEEDLFFSTTAKLDPLAQLFSLVTETFLDIVGSIVEIFSNFIDLPRVVQTFADILQFFYDLIDMSGFMVLFEAVMDFMGWLWGLFGDAIETLLKPVFEFLYWLFDLFGDAIATVLMPVMEWVKRAWGWISDVVGDAVEDVLDAVAQGIAWAWDTFGVPVMKAIGSITRWLAELIDIDVLQANLERVVTALGQIFSADNFFDMIETVFRFFASLVPDFSKFNLGDFVGQLPIISTIVAVITGKNPGDGVQLDLGTLGEWARGVEKKVRDTGRTLDDIGQKLLGGLFPVSQINFSEPNLLSQGGFMGVETVEPGVGWEWDGSLTASGTGGSVKHVSAGSVSTLFSKQSVRVASGDRLTLSAQVRNSSYSSGSMSLILIPWVGTSRYSSTSYSVTMATRSASTGSWTSISGSWTVPASVTSVQVALVSNQNTGATARFDDIYLRKTGGLGQGLVDNLIDAWRSIYQNITGSGAAIFWDAIGGAISTLTGTANDAMDGVENTNTILFGNPAGGAEVVVGALPTDDIALALGTPLATGSGARMSRRNTATKVGTVTTGGGKFDSSFYVTASATSGVDKASADITASYTNGRFTVTHAGWYEVEVGFATNASPGGAGYFCVAPAIYVNGTLNKVGGSATGSYGLGFGVYDRSAHATFIVYLGAGEYVEAGYYNFGTDAVSSFFQGDTNGVTTYFSIAMLNRTDEG